MIFYEVTDFDEYEEHFTTKAEAIKAAKSHNESNGSSDQNDFSAVVFLLDIGKADRKSVLAILNRKGFAVRREQIWPNSPSP